jgi:hypothetical protein
MNIFIVRSFVSIFVSGVTRSQDRRCEEISIQLLQKINKMPFLMKTALCILTYLFNCFGMFFGGHFFHRLDEQNQRRMVLAIEQGHFRPFKELLKFYQKMSLFIFYSI